MAWIYLLIASVLEVGWPLGLKLAEISASKISWILFAIVTMAFSGIFLYLAQKTIPIGTAYAIWTGIGASCTFILGVLILNDALSLVRCLGILLIVSGVICLKFGN